jgi:hypothetical protein
VRVPRFAVLAVALAALLGGLGRVAQHYQRERFRLRAQPLVTLLDGVARPLPGTPAPLVPPLPTSKTMEAEDAAVHGKVLALLNRGVPAEGWGKTKCVYEGHDEFTPLMVASIRRLPKTAARLIQRGAKVNTVDRDGRTALMWAVKRGNSRVEKLLLAAGADPNLVDRRGRTALDYATMYSGSWDRQVVLLRPLKRIQAEPGPYEKRHQNPYQRFTLRETRSGNFRQESSGDGIRFQSAVHFDFPNGGPPIVTREKRYRLRTGMTYPEVAAVMGEEEVGGEMVPGFEGTVTFTQGSRQIELQFHDSRVSSIGGSWW